jgi:FemAB-related protein (PEP-CTERM system-associated)
MNGLTTIDLDDSRDLARWQEFVHARPDTHCTDLAEWRRIFGELYGIRSYNHAVMRGGEIRGVLSLYHIRSPFLGNMLVTSPFFGYGGLYWDSDETRDALLAKAEELARGLGVDYVEFRLRQPLPAPYESNTDFLEFDIGLAPTAEATWNDRLAANVRQNIRKSRKHDLRFTVTSEYGPCYGLLCETLRAHGTPFHGERFFRKLVEHLGDRVQFAEVRQADQLVAAGVIVSFRDAILTPYIGSLARFRHTRANYCQYWGIVEWCCGKGIERFELGRSPKGSTHVQFKRKWGAEEVPVYYNYRVINPRKGYQSVSDPSRTQLLATGVWKRLPLALTRLIGPAVFRYIP